MSWHGHGRVHGHGHRHEHGRGHGHEYGHEYKYINMGRVLMMNMKDQKNLLTRIKSMYNITQFMFQNSMKNKYSY